MRFPMVDAVEVARFTCPASASVPVLTDHRSTPHCAYAVNPIAETSHRAAKGRLNMFSPILEGDARIADVAQAVLRILAKAAPQQPPYGWRRVLRQRVPVWLARHHRRDRVRQRIAGCEQRLPGQHL